MNLRTLNLTCYAISLASLLVAMVSALCMVWVDSVGDSLWRIFMSAVVVFLASASTLSINRTMERRRDAKPS